MGSRGRKTGWLALFLALVFALCLFCGNLVSCQMAEPADLSAPADSRQEDTVPAVKSSAVSRLERREGVYTFLLIAGTGSDAPADAFMVLCYDTQHQTAGLVSIPRDTLVSLDGQAVRLNRVQSGLEQCLSHTLGSPSTTISTWKPAVLPPWWTS